MEFGWSEEDLTFRKEVRAFLDAELGDVWIGNTAILGSPENVDFSRRFAAALAERGWLTPHWPVEHGGNAAIAGSTPSSARSCGRSASPAGRST